MTTDEPIECVCGAALRWLEVSNGTRHLRHATTMSLYCGGASKFTGIATPKRSSMQVEQKSDEG